MELPAKCQQCYKSTVSRPYRKCNICQELDLDEAVLCHLNRCVQDPETFQCHAFQPSLKLTRPLRDAAPDSYEDSERQVLESSLRLLNSEKIKYEKALALQKLDRDPDGIFVELKYHFVWNVSHRSHIFTPNHWNFESIYDIFLRCSEMVAGFVNLLWLAPDHIHLYVESDGEYSVEQMVQEVKRYSSQAILSGLKDIYNRLNEGNSLWDAAYFLQTIG
jgi:REP element-mobilizing transposase RayT